MSDLLSKMLMHHDGLSEGFSREGVINGLTLGGGFAWTRPGGFNLYRSPTSRTEGELVGSAGFMARSIRPMGWIEQRPSMRYVFTLRAVGPGGVAAVDRAASPSSTRVQVGEDRIAVDPAPPGPQRLSVAAIAGGKFRVQWQHSPSRAFAPAAEFCVYADGGSGTMDWVTPIATVAARLGLDGAGLYGINTAAFPHGDTVQFGVRASTAAGTEDANERVLAAIADAEGPADQAVVAATQGVDE